MPHFHLFIFMVVDKLKPNGDSDIQDLHPFTEISSMPLHTQWGRSLCQIWWHMDGSPGPTSGHLSISFIW
jgi:hypothetical protein